MLVRSARGSGAGGGAARGAHVAAAQVAVRLSTATWAMERAATRKRCAAGAREKKLRGGAMRAPRMLFRRGGAARVLRRGRAACVVSRRGGARVASARKGGVIRLELGQIGELTEADLGHRIFTTPVNPTMEYGEYR